ncbi:MAG: GxxExxY protein [Kiritimatiellia bacterium]
MTDQNLNELTEKIIGIAIDVHKELGPGLLESVYQQCLASALREAGLKVVEQIDVPVVFRGRIITDSGYRLDMLVEDLVIIELKSVKELKDIDKKQLLTYLRLMKKHLGLLMNFNVVLLKDGIKRIIN